MKYRASDYLSLPDVAETLGCSRQTIYRLIECGELEGIQLRDHGWWRVSERSLDRYVQRRMTKRARPAAQSTLSNGTKKKHPGAPKR
jgi:excisionase family DNA binding protein